MGNKIDKKTIQLWPSGKSVTFSERGGKFTVYPDGGCGVKAGAELARQIEIELLAEQYIERDIFFNDTSLVSDLIRADFEGFQSEDIENMYQNPEDWTLAKCREWLRDNGVGEDSELIEPNDLSRERCVEMLAGVWIDSTDDQTVETLRTAVEENINDETLDGIDAWRDRVRDESQDNPNEAYQWFRVDRWLCDELKKAGEIVIDNGSGHWWGRGCCGQALVMDGTIQKIAAKFVN